MELCINQSLRRIVDIAEMGSVQTSSATSKSQKVKVQALPISAYFSLFRRKYKVERVGLPEVENLTKEQAGHLANALENAFNALGKIVAFPANLPTHMRYSFLRKVWLGDAGVLYYTPRIIEPCTEHELDCPFKGVCRLCEKYDEEID
jgi:hypothetical protein